MNDKKVEIIVPQMEEHEAEEKIELAKNELSAIENKIKKYVEDARLIQNKLRQEIESLEDELKIKTALFEKSGTKGVLYNSKIYNDAMDAKNQTEKKLQETLAELAMEENIFQQQQTALLEIKSTIEKSLKHAHAELAQFREGSRTSVEALDIYSNHERLDEDVSKTRAIRSTPEKDIQFKREKQFIIDEATKNQSIVAGLINDSESRINEIKDNQTQNQEDQKDVEFLTQVESENYKQIVYQKRNHDEIINKSAPAWSSAFYRYIVEPIYHLFGLKTKKDKALDVQNEINQKLVESTKKLTELGHDAKELKSQSTTLSSELREEEASLNHLKAQAEQHAVTIQTNLRSAKAESLEQVGTQIDEIRLQKNNLKATLLDRCKQNMYSRWVNSKNPSALVKKDLEKFLINPTNHTLYTLKQTMKKNPTYLKDTKLTSLLIDTQELFDETILPSGKLIDVLTNQKVENEEKIHQLNEEKKVQEQTLKNYKEMLDSQSLDNQSLILRNLETNKEALMNCYYLLSVVKLMVDQDPVAINDLIFSVEDKIRQIKQTIPEAEIPVFTIPNLNKKGAAGGLQEVALALCNAWGKKLDSKVSDKLSQMVSIADISLEFLARKNSKKIREQHIENALDSIDHISRALFDTDKDGESVLKVYSTFFENINAVTNDKDIKMAFVTLKNNINNLSSRITHKFNEIFTQTNNVIDKLLEHTSTDQPYIVIKQEIIPLEEINWVESNLLKINAKLKLTEKRLLTINDELVNLREKNVKLEIKKQIVAEEFVPETDSEQFSPRNSRSSSTDSQGSTDSEASTLSNSSLTNVSEHIITSAKNTYKNIREKFTKQKNKDVIQEKNSNEKHVENNPSINRKHEP